MNRAIVVTTIESLYDTEKLIQDLGLVARLINHHGIDVESSAIYVHWVNFRTSVINP